MSELKLTDANFEQEVLKSTVPVFVDFWAPWCGPCKVMGPVVEELAQEYAGKNIKIAKMNVDDNTTPGQFGIMSIPTFIIFKDGKEMDRRSGGMPKEKLQEFLDSAL